jgi:hypothetical protein
MCSPWGRAMTRVLVVMTGNIQSNMQEMRAWLDSTRCEPSLFQYQATQIGDLAQVEFKSQSEAEAFAAHFQGRLLTGSAA